MFVQAIRAKVKDADAARAAGDKWQSDLKPGAKGYLGVTNGVTDDGRSITLVRFESEAAAQANADRPEQGEWFNNELAPHLTDVEFFNCPDVQLFMGGGNDSAGFVQVMIYKPSDLGAVKELIKGFENVAGERPDILGGMLSISTDGTVFDCNYFTSEAEAREAESKPMSDDMQKAMGTFQKVAGNVEFLDIRDPELR